jgi:3-hydroxyacyl-CoA dehydrogenase
MGIHKIACVGAGLIGQGWATLFSSQGFEVILQDVSESILEAFRTKTLEEIADWRDEMLVRLLKVMRGEQDRI